MSINILSKIVLFHQVISYGNQRRKSLSENNIYKQHRFVHVYVCVCVSVCVRAFFFGPLHVEQSSRYAWN